MDRAAEIDAETQKLLDELSEGQKTVSHYTALDWSKSNQHSLLIGYNHKLCYDWLIYTKRDFHWFLLLPYYKTSSVIGCNHGNIHGWSQ